jgi:hypothetical protein
MLGAGAVYLWGKRSPGVEIPEAEPEEPVEPIYGPCETEFTEGPEVGPTGEEESEEEPPITITTPTGPPSPDEEVIDGEIVPDEIPGLPAPSGSVPIRPQVPEEVDLSPPYITDFGFYDNLVELSETLDSRMKRMNKVSRIGESGFDMQEILRIYKGDIGGNILDILTNLREDYDQFYQSECGTPENRDRFPIGRVEFLARLKRAIQFVDDAYRKAGEGMELIQDHPGSQYRRLGKYVLEAHELLRQTLGYTRTHLTKHSHHKFSEKTGTYVIDQKTGKVEINYSIKRFREDTAEIGELYYNTLEKLTGEQDSIYAYVRDRAEELGRDFDYTPDNRRFRLK